MRPSRRRRVVVMGSAANEGSDSLVRAWRGRGLAAELVSSADALTTMGPADTLVCRLDVLPTLDGVEPGLLAVLLLERRGVRVVNPVSSLLAAHDKLRTARVFGAVGLPHPRTCAVSRSTRAADLRPPVVLKPRYGSWGKDVFRCESRREVEETLEAVADRPWFRRHGGIAQELLPSPRSDLRVIVAGGHVVGAAERVAAPGEWRTNVSLGGSLVPADPGDDAAELAETAAAVIGAELVGVDLLPLPDGRFVVLELNGAVDFDGTYSLHGGSVFEDAAAALELL
jgi:RimK family alpha-L-glutamate ligase